MKIPRIILFSLQSFLCFIGKSVLVAGGCLKLIQATWGHQNANQKKEGGRDMSEIKKYELQDQAVDGIVDWDIVMEAQEIAEEGPITEEGRPEDPRFIIRREVFGQNRVFVAARACTFADFCETVQAMRQMRSPSPDEWPRWGASELLDFLSGEEDRPGHSTELEVWSGQDNPHYRTVDTVLRRVGIAVDLREKDQTFVYVTSGGNMFVWFRGYLGACFPGGSVTCCQDYF